MENLPTTPLAIMNKTLVEKMRSVSSNLGRTLDQFFKSI